MRTYAFTTAGGNVFTVRCTEDTAVAISAECRVYLKALGKRRKK